MFRKATEPPARQAKSSITETAPCRKSLRLHIKPESIQPVRSVVLAEFQKQATLPGFRKGKAPTNLVERQYAQAIQDETLKRVARQALEEAAKEHDLKPVGPFELTTADFTEADGLKLEARVEVEPAFSLGDYRGIPLTASSPEISEQEMGEAVGKLQESMAQLVPSGEGEKKERQLPPVDNELAKDLGFENLDKLREHVHAKLSEQKRTEERRTLEAALSDELLRRHAFEVPPGLVTRQAERLTRDFKVRLLLSGISEEQVGQEAEKFTEQLRTSAERHVKISFILDRVAEQETIQVTQDELVERLWQLAKRWKKDPADVRKTFDAQGLWPSVISAIRQEKTIAVLIAAAVVNGKTTPVAAEQAGQPG